jgi:NAD+ kinase
VAALDEVLDIGDGDRISLVDTLQDLTAVLPEESYDDISATAEGAGWEPQWALNEVIVEKRARHRVVRLAASVNGDHVTTFSADGVIVASPTGSTAYSFSARGPIVSPRLPCLVLTPVSAHMVFDRAVVLAPDERVTLEVREEEPALLSADGRLGLELPAGARVSVRRSDRPARLLRREVTESFYSLLRRKFSLPADPEG